MWQYSRKFLYILGERKKALGLLVAFIFLNSILEMLGIGLIGPFIALATQPNIINNTPWLNWTYEAFNFTSASQFVIASAGFILIIFYIKSFFSFKVRQYIFWFGLSHQGELRTRLLDSYLRMPYAFHLKNNTAFLIQSIVNETDTFCNGTLLQILNATVSLVMMVALVGLLLVTDAVATLIISLILLLAFGLVVHFRRQLSSWGKTSSTSKAEMIRIINHGLGGLKETRVIGCEPYFEEQLKCQAQRYADACSSLMSFGLIPRLLIEALVITFILGLASTSLIMGRDPGSLVATLGVFGVVAIRLMPVATQLTSGLTKLKSSSYVVHKLHYDLKEIARYKKDLGQELLLQPQAPEQQGLVAFPFEHKVELDRVSFQYEGAKEMALNQVNLTLNKGESIAFIGKSGAGKTTLVDLILGLLSPESGDIQVDDQSIYRDLRAWQNLLGYIPQSIFLIDDTLERNVAFGVPDDQIDSERLQRSIEAAQLSDLIERLPDGINTRIGERGVCLSGGQRQRIGIARALYHEREILVLDEATSALDTETEELVTEAIKSLSGNKTMIIIAHRLTTVEHCDRIYVMEKGAIVNSGSYKEVVLDGNPVPTS
ncbi:MAG: ABC transporter ATP-binding protein [Leptolyngbyaceae cyanobacterium MO_188.B28]|nr:ABC transporter ATP-binding protein [Leptolyngbyaceae cyanobacterium MO_188.B28]